MNTPLELLIKIEHDIPKMIESWQKYRRDFPDGTIIYIPLGLKYLNKEYYIGYDLDGIQVCYESWGDMESYFRLAYGSTTHTSEIDSNTMGVILTEKDSSIGVRFDKRGSDKCLFGGFDFENDICYLNGNDFDGIEEAMFQFSLVNETMRDPVELINEGKTSYRIAQSLPKNWVLIADDTAILDSIRRLEFISEYLL